MKKIAFIHGRPYGHPTHAEYARSVHAIFLHEDKYLRWQDLPKASKIKRYTSWFLNAFLFPQRKEYDIFLTECIRIPQLIMKKFGLINKKQKLVALMGDESLYFLSIKKYPYLTQLIMRAFLNSCDLLICTSAFQAELARSLVTNKNVLIQETYNGLRIQDYLKISLPKFNNQKILFLGNIEASWRAWYKGIDLLLTAFESYALKNQNAELHIIGSVTDEVKSELENSIIEKSVLNRINFKGNYSNLRDILHEYDLVVHPSRGEAWGVTVHMALACGVPAIVSKFTGTKEIISKINNELIVGLSKGEIINKLSWYFSLSKEEKKELSIKCRKAALTYTDSSAIASFQKALNATIS
ncbi:MAG: glycosyltransferase family 4 protein [Flavobacteriaceae bacterium]|nr:glycosyltransferase family 4 protein [Flavobacteriaceae bacterium]